LIYTKKGENVANGKRGIFKMGPGNRRKEEGRKLKKGLC
jgi:hypothetical protein